MANTVGFRRMRARQKKQKHIVATLSNGKTVDVTEKDRFHRINQVLKKHDDDLAEKIAKELEFDDGGLVI